MKSPQRSNHDKILEDEESKAVSAWKRDENFTEVGNYQDVMMERLHGGAKTVKTENIYTGLVSSIVPVINSFTH